VHGCDSGSNHRMRKIIRFIFALIFAFGAFEIVDLWPVGPMWSKPGEKVVIIGLSDDERTLYVVQGLSQHDRYDKGSKLSFVKSDLHTGMETGRTEFSVDANFENVYFSHDAEFKKLLICGEKYSERQGKISWDYHYCLLDTGTGQPLCGPRDCGGMAVMQLSPDGRWIWSTTTNITAFFGNTIDPSNLLGRVISSLDGKTVFQTDSCYPRGGGGRFSEDSSKIAWLALDSQQKGFLLRIASISSGKLLGEYPLPWEGAQMTGAWKGDTISLTEHKTTAQSISVGIRTFRLSEKSITILESTPFLQDTLLENNTIFFAKTSTILQLRLNKAAWSEAYVKLIEFSDTHFQTLWRNNLSSRATFRFFDSATQKRRLDISLDDCADWGVDNVISESGRYFFNISGQPKMFQVWDLESSRRWPWALTASVGTLLLIFLFGRWRRKRSVRSSGAFSLPLPAAGGSFVSRLGY